MVGAAGRSLVGAGGELGLCPRGSRCALTAHAARSRHALRARGMRSRLARAHSFYFSLQKIYEFIHDNCKKYMNSYIIRIIFVWIHIFKVQKIYEFILNSSYIWIHMLYEFIHSTGREIKILPRNQNHQPHYMCYHYTTASLGKTISLLILILL